MVCSMKTLRSSGTSVLVALEVTSEVVLRVIDTEVEKSAYHKLSICQPTRLEGKGSNVPAFPFPQRV